LLIYGELPTASQIETFRRKLRRHSMLHEDMRLFYDGFPRDAHPMAILSSVCGALSTFYQDSLSVKDPEQVNHSVLRLLAKLPTIAAYAFKKSIGQPFVYPRNDLTYCETFLRMMFAVPTELEMPQDKALESLNRWAGSPLPVTASAWRDGELCLRLSGAERAVQAAAAKLGGEALEDAPAARFWAGIREQNDAWFAGDAPLWRLSVPSAAAPLELPGALLIEWGGALRWLRSGAEAASVRAAAARAGGHATLFRGGDKTAGVFAPLAPALLRLHRELKAAFDPAGIFNPGRLHPDF
jgi:hypothetical protein